MTQTVLLRLSVFCGLFSILLLIVDKRASALVVAVAGIVFLSLDLRMEDFWQDQPVVVRHRKQVAKPIWDRTQGAKHRSFVNDQQTSSDNQSAQETQTTETGADNQSAQQTQTTETGADNQSAQQTAHTQTTTKDEDTNLPGDLSYGEFFADHTGPPRGVGARPTPACSTHGNDRLRRIEPVKTYQHYHSQTGRLSRYAWLS